MQDNPRKILLVDDDRHFMRILNDWFTSKGFKTYPAHNGKDALDIFERESPDIVLLDALIPKMDGFKTCEAMRKDPSKKRIPIIIMSAVYRSARDAQLAKTKYGATDYIEKPLDLLKVYEMVRKLLPG